MLLPQLIFFKIFTIVLGNFASSNLSSFVQTFSNLNGFFFYDCFNFILNLIILFKYRITCLDWIE